MQIFLKESSSSALCKIFIFQARANVGALTFHVGSRGFVICYPDAYAICKCTCTYNSLVRPYKLNIHFSLSLKMNNVHSTNTLFVYKNCAIVKTYMYELLYIFI